MTDPFGREGTSPDDVPDLEQTTVVHGLPNPPGVGPSNVAPPVPEQPPLQQPPPGQQLPPQQAAGAAPPPGHPTLDPAIAPSLPAGYGPDWEAAGAVGGHAMAGFGSRLGAWLIDRLIMTLLALVAAVPLGLWLIATYETTVEVCASGVNLCDTPTDDWFGRVFIAAGIYVLAALLISFLYQLPGLARKGQTIGRRVMSIKVIKEDTGLPPGWGPGIARLFMGFVSGQIFYLGHLWQLWDDKNQTWHDKVAGTIVINDL